MRFYVVLFLLISILTVAYDYSIVVQTEPFLNVYLDGVFVGATDFEGKLTIPLRNAGKFEITINGSWIVPSTVFATVYYPGENFVVVPVRRAGALRIFSNIYPVEVYCQDMYLGTVQSVKDIVYAPEGTVNITFRSPGCVSIEKSLSFSYRKETSVSITFHEEELNVDLKIEPETFSPNGDWYQDETTFYIYLSKSASLEINIYDSSGQKVFHWEGQGKPGTNQLTWNGENTPDGTYRAELLAQTEGEEYTAVSYVTIDRSNYTYTKEITIGIVGAVGAALLLLLLFF